VGVHNDITIPEGAALLFQWSGTNHDILEMASPVDNECTFVTSNAEELGQVRGKKEKRSMAYYNLSFC